MAECIEREATIKPIKEVYCVGCNSYNGVRCRACGTGDAIDIIEDAPAADVAPVVRCKDCEHAERYERADGTTGYYCGHPQNTFTYGEYWDRVFKPAKEADDYCSYGERKDGGADHEAG